MLALEYEHYEKSSFFYEKNNKKYIIFIFYCYFIHFFNFPKR